MGLTTNFLPAAQLFNSTANKILPFWSISIRRIPGDGHTISFWKHDWGLGVLQTRCPALYSHALQPHVTLSAPLNNLTKAFSQQLSEAARQQLQQMLSEIGSLPTLNQARTYDVLCVWASDGTFSVKTAYYAIKNGLRIKTNIKRIWKLRAPPRFQVFDWLVILNRILTIDNHVKRGWCMVNMCVLCRSQSEMVAHILQDCQTTRSLHRRVAVQFKIRQGNLAALIGTEYTKDERSIFLITMFILWRERCKRKFKDQCRTEEELMEQVKTQCAYSAIQTEAIKKGR